MERAEALREISQIIRENIGDIACDLVRNYAHAYPADKAGASLMESGNDRAESSLVDFANSLETDEPQKLVYTYNYICADLLPENDRRTRYYSISLDTLIYMAQNIAAHIYSSCYPDARKGAQLAEVFESFVQEVIRMDTELYLEQVMAKGSLTMTWDQPLPSSPLAALTEKQAPAEDDARAVLVGSLTQKERCVFNLLIQGRSNGQIAAELSISQNTVKQHVSRIFDKFNVNSRVELISKYA